MYMMKMEIMIMIMIMMKMKMIKPPLRSRVWPLMTIRKRRWGVRLSEENSERPKKNSRSGRVSEEFATVLEEFESAVSQPAELF